MEKRLTPKTVALPASGAKDARCDAFQNCPLKENRAAVFLLPACGEKVAAAG